MFVVKELVKAEDSESRVAVRLQFKIPPIP
jgi:hypothetical protein